MEQTQKNQNLRGLYLMAKRSSDEAERLRRANKILITALVGVLNYHPQACLQYEKVIREIREKAIKALDDAREV